MYDTRRRWRPRNVRTLGNGSDDADDRADRSDESASADDTADEDEENAGGDENTAEEDDTETEADETSLELSVSATDSVAVLEEHVDFHVTVANQGAESATVPVVLEIAHVDEELETLEIDADESGDAYRSIEAREFGSGEHDWTIIAGDAVETGTVTVESDEEYDEGRGDLELTMEMVDGAVVRLQDGESSTRIGCDMTVFNHGDEPVSTVGEFEIADQTKPIEVDLDGRASTHIRKIVEVDEGDHEWTATVGGETETGTLHVVSE
jgi:hypothetical protein